MNKKLLTMALTLAMTASMATAMVGCDNSGNKHTHIFQKKLLHYDETHHWQACSVAGCTEIQNKEEHNLDKRYGRSEEDVIYYCLNCDYTKTYNENGDGDTSTAPDWWKNALSQQVIGFTQTSHIVTDEVTSDVEIRADIANKRILTVSTVLSYTAKVLYTKQGNEYYYYQYTNGTWNKNTISESSFNNSFAMATSTQDLLTALKGKYDDFVYADGVYTMQNLNEGDWQADTITLKFENQQLKEMTTYSSNSEGTSNATMIFGVVEIEIPQV